MTTREWLARVFEINNYLPRFPNVGTPGVSPSKLAEDEIKEIAEFGVPYRWQQQMRVVNFNPVKKTIPEFIDFCERLEQIDTAENNNDPARKTPEKSKGKRKRDHKSDSDKSAGSQGSKYCLLHGQNDTHNSDNCYTLKKIAKKKRDDKTTFTPEKKAKRGI